MLQRVVDKCDKYLNPNPAAADLTGSLVKNVLHFLNQDNDAKVEFEERKEPFFWIGPINPTQK